MSEQSRYVVPAVDQACRVLFTLLKSDQGALTLTEICRNTGINKGKVYSLLKTLEKHGLVMKKVEQKGYSLGPAFVSFSRKVLDSLNIPKLAEPVLKDLSEKTGSTAVLGLIIQDAFYIVSKYERKNDLGINCRIGMRFPVTFASHGKAIAACLSDSELEELLRKPKLYFYGKPERYDKERVLKEIEECRRKGFALEVGDVNAGINTVASAVIGPNNKPIGAIILFGLFPAQTAIELGPYVHKAAVRLSKMIGADAERLERRDTFAIPEEG